MIENSARVAKFVNTYPNIEVSYSIEDADELDSATPITVNVTLDREVDEADTETGSADQIADAPHFPHRKMVSWWLVVGDPTSKQLYAIKKVTVKARLETKLDFNLPVGEWQLKLYLICDSYSGADQDFDMDKMKVVQGEDSDDESDEDESGDENAMQQD